MSAGPRINRSSVVTQVALMLDLDSRTADICQRLEKKGIRCIVLKGPAIANWLYTDGSLRAYRDSDLLVSAEDIPRVEELLQEWGYVHPPRDDLPGDRPWHAHFWTDGSHDLDLHRTLIGVRKSPEELWSYLSTQTEYMSIGGAQLEVLSVPARLAHVVLHAAQDGVRLVKPLQDLDRALDQIDFATWVQACEIAHDLGATASFQAGLHLLPQGRQILDRLGMRSRADAEVFLRAKGGPTLSLGFDWLWTTPGFASKLRYLRYKVVPPVTFMKAWTPLARKGRLGLALSYPWRVMWLCFKAPRGFTEWLRARRST